MKQRRLNHCLQSKIPLSRRISSLQFKNKWKWRLWTLGGKVQRKWKKDFRPCSLDCNYKQSNEEYTVIRLFRWISISNNQDNFIGYANWKPYKRANCIIIVYSLLLLYTIYSQRKAWARGRDKIENL